MNSSRKTYVRKYLFDWVSLVITGAVILGINFIHPYERNFSVTDKTIQYPHKSDTVPFWAAVMICYIFPLLVVIGLTMFRKGRKDWFAMHTGILALTATQAANQLFTNTIKNLAGRPRPDFISRCAPSVQAINSANGFGSSNNANLVRDPVFGLFTTSICTAKRDSVFYDGMRSFFSGHSSTAFAGMTFLSLFLAANMKIYNRKAYTQRALVTTLPILVAGLIAVSRVSDYRHHWQDVLTGSIVGAAIAYFFYYIYYPKLHSEKPNAPFRDRIDDIDMFSVENNDQLRMSTDP
ncbi:hypothetical protein BB560_002040 [Smittium megazygosporum]|uniref:Phosphatidic acid phosphatase type 2/haloperoxidase domain-containing protein n=1 Tax=Smittium megazygosporum TaxID=133381 RepID=A0A2T9ZFX4_9FUNG|nr:hypothetical protein BB560_002040 [Smittium megazygosporum]